MTFQMWFILHNRKVFLRKKLMIRNKKHCQMHEYNPKFCVGCTEVVIEDFLTKDKTLALILIRKVYTYFSI